MISDIIKIIAAILLVALIITSIISLNRRENEYDGKVYYQLADGTTGQVSGTCSFEKKPQAEAKP